MTAEIDAPARSRCLGTDCPECAASRRHYRDTGCLVPDCPGGHGVFVRVTSPGSSER